MIGPLIGTIPSTRHACLAPLLGVFWTSAAPAAEGAAAARYRYGATQQRVLAVEANAVTQRIARDYEVQDGLGLVYVRVGHARVARLVSTRPAARLFPDLAPLGAPDGVITAGDGWLVRQIAAPVERMLLSSARRLLYEAVPRTAWLGHDHLGSLTIEVGQGVIGRRAHAPLGAVRKSTGDTDRYDFTAQETDASGLVHFQFRQMDPRTGRWAAPDPLFAASGAANFGALGESSTAYAYVANRPTSLTDPTGLLGIFGKLRNLFGGRRNQSRPSETVKLARGTSIASHQELDGYLKKHYPASPWKQSSLSMGDDLRQFAQSEDALMVVARGMRRSQLAQRFPVEVYGEGEMPNRARKGRLSPGKGACFAVSDELARHLGGISANFDYVFGGDWGNHGFAHLPGGPGQPSIIVDGTWRQFAGKLGLGEGSYPQILTGTPKEIRTTLEGWGANGAFLDVLIRGYGNNS